MKLQRLDFNCDQASDLLLILSKILPQMTALREFIFRTDEIKEEAYQAFIQCLPETAIESLTLYGDLHEERVYLLADALEKSRIIEVCLSSTKMAEEKMLEMVLSRTRMNIRVSEEFFNEKKKNNFQHIIQLLCKYEVYSFKFESKELPLSPVQHLIAKLPQTHLLSLSLPRNIKKQDQALLKLLNLSDRGNTEIKYVLRDLEKVLPETKIKEICLPEYTAYLSIDVFFFLRKFKLKETFHDELLKRLLK